MAANKQAPRTGTPTGAVGNVWLRPTRAARAGEPLTRERIVTGAIELLDEEGMDRLTMRRLAERLQVGTTTLYWHVATKDDVIDLAVDAIFGEAIVPGKHTRSPRNDITVLLGNWRQAMLRHPWSGALSARQRPLLGPNFLRWMEFLQSALLRIGLADSQLNASTWALYNHVMGSTATQSSLHVSPEEARAGKEYLEAQREKFPTVAEHSYITDDDWDRNFVLGLEFLLNGISQAAQSR